MRNLCRNVLSATDNLSTNGDQQDSNQLVSASFQAYFGDATAAGTFKIQASNDPCAYGNLAADFVATHWTDIPSATAAITAGASSLITIANMSYRWVRAVYVSTAIGIQTVTTVADVAGSLNSKYFYINAGNLGVAYYVWLNVNSAGVDPLIAGKTGVEVAVTTGATAATIATAVAAALEALPTFASAAVGAVATVTNSNAGPFIAAVDVNTGFSFAITGGGTSTINVNINAIGF